MARNLAIEPTSEADDTVLVEHGDDVELDILNEMNAAESDVTWKFTVCRVTGAAKSGASEPHLFSGDASQLEGIQDRLRDTYGTGQYRIRVFRNRRLYRRFDVAVEAPQKPSLPPQQQSEMATVLAVIATQNEKTMQMLERLAERQQQPLQAPIAPVNPFTALTEMAAAMGAVMKIMQPAQATSATDMILKGVELRDKLAAGAGGNDSDDDGDVSVMGLLKSALQSPVVQQILQLPQTQPASPVQQVMSSQPQAQPSGLPVIAADKQNEAMIKHAVTYLNIKATAKKDVGFYADWVFDNWSSELITVVLQHPQPLQLLVSFVPETQPNLAWFQKLIEELRKLVNTANERASASVNNAPGNPAAATFDGHPGRDSGSEENASDDEWSS